MESQEFDCLVTSTDQLTDIIWTVRTDGKISSSNQHWQTFIGMPANADLEQTFPPISCMHPSDLNKLEQLWLQARASNQSFTSELRFKRASDQQYRWHLLRAWPTGGAEFQTQDWIIISTDVHHLKTVQSMFQLVMDNIPISIFWKDRNSRYIGCNRMFTPENGRITIALIAQKYCFRVEVTDNGPGIDADDQKHLFDRFWQGSAGRKYSQSTGLGLYLCKKIVEAHRGMISCDSAAGCCKFTFSIPLRFSSVGS